MAWRGSGWNAADEATFEHGPAPARDHLRQQAPGHVHDGDDVELGHLDLALAVELLEAPAAAEAGVVHQHLDREPAAAHLGDDLAATLRRGDVAGDHLGAHLVPQLRGQLLEPVGSPGDQRHALAATRERSGDLRPDAAGGAGYEAGRVLRGGRERHGVYDRGAMSSEDPFGGLFGDPDELRKRLGEMAEQMQGAQKVAWADNAIKLAADMTIAGINRLNLQGNAEQQAVRGPRSDSRAVP